MCNGCVTAVAVGQSQQLLSGVRTLSWFDLSRSMTKSCLIGRKGSIFYVGLYHNAFVWSLVVGVWRWEVGVWKWEFGDGRWEFRGGSLEVGVWRWEVGVGSLEVGVRRWKVGV
jgi:hypothetical protein